MPTFSTIELQTSPGESLTNITDKVQQAIKNSGVKEGVCVVVAPHTTAGLTLNSAIDPSTAADLILELHRLVPTRVDFQHTYDTPADAAGHIKATLVGNSATLIVTGGNAVLGSSQSILFFEFDGPRERKVHVQVLGMKD
jgi:secondary thiamine-phosphate synthase enzyme